MSSSLAVEARAVALREGARPWLPNLLMAASGFAGLGYEIIWTERCALSLGHEASAVLAVLAAFFGGLAAGGLLLGPRIERSRHPGRWYAACELVIAIWGAALLLLWSPFGEGIAALVGVEPAPAWLWLVSFGGTFLLFLPACVAMGATLPALERVVGLAAPKRSLSALYAANTFGAVLGVLVTSLWLVPSFGVVASTFVCVSLNLVGAVVAFVVFARHEPSASSAVATGRVSDIPSPRPDTSKVTLRLAATGLLGIGFEVVVVRVLGQVTEDTVYTFALSLAVYLVGSAAGAALYRRYETRIAGRDIDVPLFVALSLGCLLGASTLWGAEGFKAEALPLLGASFGTALTIEALLALLAFAVPTLLMGALCCHLCARAHAAGVSFGRALGVNTLAAAAAPALFGVVVVPAFGPKVALLTIALGYLVVAPWQVTTQDGARVERDAVSRIEPRLLLAMPTVGVVLLGAFAPPLRFVDPSEGSRILFYEEGTMAAVSVVEDAEGVRRLRINNRAQEGSNVGGYVDGRQAWLPLLLHPEPRQALFLGLGTGVTASAAARDEGLRVDAVELLPEVVGASSFFVADPVARSRLNVFIADARRYVRASEHGYDVIVSDNFHPARSGSGALYTVEHFEAVSSRLNSGGVFCQWLPLHQLDLSTLASIVASFIEVFPAGLAVLASNSLETPVVGLVALAGEGRLDAEIIRARVSAAREAGPARELGFEDEFAVLGAFIAGPSALAELAGGAALNTDDHPVVAYRAPRLTYAPQSSPQDRLRELLGALFLEIDEVVVAAAPSFSRRLFSYWVARNRFIEFGRDINPSLDVDVMLSRVRQPLLALLRTSPDFRPAYDPLFSMATALVRTDPSRASHLLTELSHVQPLRLEAPRLLAQLRAGKDDSPSRDGASD